MHRQPRKISCWFNDRCLLSPVYALLHPWATLHFVLFSTLLGFCVNNNFNSNGYFIKQLSNTFLLPSFGAQFFSHTAYRSFSPNFSASFLSNFVLFSFILVSFLSFQLFIHFLIVCFPSSCLLFAVENNSKLLQSTRDNHRSWPNCSGTILYSWAVAQRKMLLARILNHFKNAWNYQNRR